MTVNKAALSDACKSLVTAIQELHMPAKVCTDSTTRTCRNVWTQRHV